MIYTDDLDIQYIIRKERILSKYFINDLIDKDMGGR